MPQARKTLYGALDGPSHLGDCDRHMRDPAGEAREWGDSH